MFLSSYSFNCRIGRGKPRRNGLQYYFLSLTPCPHPILLPLSCPKASGVFLERCLPHHGSSKKLSILNDVILWGFVMVRWPPRPLRETFSSSVNYASPLSRVHSYSLDETVFFLFFSLISFCLLYPPDFFHMKGSLLSSLIKAPSALKVHMNEIRVMLMSRKPLISSHRCSL